jgi:hypothetical protein
LAETEAKDPRLRDLLFLSAFAFVDSRLQRARPLSIPSLRAKDPSEAEGEAEAEARHCVPAAPNARAHTARPRLRMRKEAVCHLGPRMPH